MPERFSPRADLVPEHVQEPNRDDHTSQPSRPPQTAAELRGDIDSGRTRDKVDFPDPAAAPLGTDAEAGGQPPQKAQLRRESPAITRAPERRSFDEGAQRIVLMVGWLAVLVLVLGLVYLAVPSA